MDNHHLQHFPACIHYTALYLQQTSDSKAVVEEAVYALAWVHSIAGIPSTTDNLFIKTTVEGLRRILPRPGRRRNPSLLTCWKQWCKTPLSITLSNVWLTPACLLIFAGFLQFNELVNIRSCDLSFSDDMLILFLPWSKTDQLRKGNEVILARTKPRLALSVCWRSTWRWARF